jgi:aspartate aminotransferase
MDVVRLNIGEPDVDSPPHINQVGAEQILAGNSHYTDPQGIPALRRAIASHVTRTRGVKVDPERVVVTAGAKPSIGYTMQTYIDPGDEVIYPSPGFPIYESWVTYVGATPRPLHLSEERGFAFTAEDLDVLVTDRTKVIVLNPPSNPTGGVLSEGDLRDIAGVIRRRCGPHVRIFSDEIYEHSVFDGRGHHSIIGEEGGPIGPSS